MVNIQRDREELEEFSIQLPVRSFPLHEDHVNSIHLGSFLGRVGFPLNKLPGINIYSTEIMDKNYG